MRVSPVPVLRIFGAGYVNIVRNTPLTLVFFFFAFAYPRLEIVDLSFFARACIALIVYTVGVRLRGGPVRGEHGAGRAGRGVPGAGLHLRPDPGRRSSCPRRCASVVPPLTNVQIALLKNTTIAAGFSVFEAGGIYQNLSERGYNVLVGLLWVAVGFLILVVPLTLLQRNLERRWSVAR